MATTTTTGVMSWRCKNCDEENAGITLSLGLRHPDCLRWLEIRCKKCAKPYRWMANDHQDVASAGGR